MVVVVTMVVAVMLGSEGVVEEKKMVGERKRK